MSANTDFPKLWSDPIKFQFKSLSVCLGDVLVVICEHADFN